MVLMLPKAIMRRQETYEGSDQGTLVVAAELSAGAFGVVSRCVSSAGRTFAVKKVSRGVSAALGELVCLYEGLRHKNLLRVHEAFRSQKGELCLLMGFATGCELFQRAGTLTAREGLTTAMELGDALRYLHRQGFVHRDCKPENVMMTMGGVVLVDVGSMRPTGCLACVEGTLAYMAPEARNKRTHKVLPALDAWSMGVTLCAALLGSLPKDRLEAKELAQKRPSIASIVLAATSLMVTDEEARFTIPSFLSALQEALGHVLF